MECYLLHEVLVGGRHFGQVLALGPHRLLAVPNLCLGLDLVVGDQVDVLRGQHPLALVHHHVAAHRGLDHTWKLAKLLIALVFGLTFSYLFHYFMKMSFKNTHMPLLKNTALNLNLIKQLWCLSMSQILLVC